MRLSGFFSFFAVISAVCGSISHAHGDDKEWSTVHELQKKVDAEFEREVSRLRPLDDARSKLAQALISAKGDLNVMFDAARNMASFAEVIYRLSLQKSFNATEDEDKAAFLKALCSSGGFGGVVKDAPKDSKGAPNFNRNLNQLDAYDKYKEGRFFRRGFEDFQSQLKTFRTHMENLSSAEKPPVGFKAADFISPRSSCDASILHHAQAQLEKLSQDVTTIAGFCSGNGGKYTSSLLKSADDLKDALVSSLIGYDRCSVAFNDQFEDVYRKGVDQNLYARFNQLIAESGKLRNRLTQIKEGWKKEDAAREKRYQESLKKTDKKL